MASNIHELLVSALAELRASHAAQGRAITAIEAAVRADLQRGLDALPEATAPATEHRREHRSGHAPKIDTDPELRTFIAARIERMTFDQIATEIAEHFPPDRRVRRSAIHAWWRKQQKRSSR